MSPTISLSLYPFQEEGVRFLLNHSRSLLADDMGLGKTIQIAAAINRLFTSDSIQRVLIIAPASLIHNWKMELGSWCPNIPVVLYRGPDRYGLLEGHAKIILSSYESITRDLKSETNSGKTYYDIGIDLLVLDEAQKIKSPDSHRSKIISRIIAPWRWAVTGTPLENNPKEFASILRFLDPNEFNNTEDLESLELMLKMRDQYMIRRLKNEVGLQLPDKAVHYLTVEMTPSQSAEYTHVLESINSLIVNRHGIETRKSFNLLAKLQQLRKISTISSSQESSKIDLLEDELIPLVAEGSKVVLFSSFPHLFPLLVLVRDVV